jgi:mannose-6-phosphate isomerase-like protein (cupin superfamily)
MEAMNAPHVGINTGSEPVRLLAVYMGAKHAKDVIPVR